MCVPAWDVTAVHAEPDAWLAHPDPASDQRTALFWNRHVDHRFSLHYPHSRRDSSRIVGRSVTDPLQAWGLVDAERLRILKHFNIKAHASPGDIARALADWFLHERFQHRTTCPAFKENPRELSSGFEAVFYQSNCHGCARAYAILGDLSGLTTRTIGCGAHIVAEVLLEGRWHHIENAGRRDPELGALFTSSYIQSYIDPHGDFGIRVNEKYRVGLYKRPNPQFHFHHGHWDGPLTLRWSMQCAAALYPEVDRLPCKAEPGLRLPLVRYARGFYWPVVHASDQPAMAALRERAVPGLLNSQTTTRDYLYHYFTPGQLLRQTFWLDSLTGVEAVELTLTWASTRTMDWNAIDGSKLRLIINDQSHPLTSLTTWPPVDRDTHPISLTISLPKHQLHSHAVNEVVLANDGAGLLLAPCAPAVLDGIPPALGLR